MMSLRTQSEGVLDGALNLAELIYCLCNQVKETQLYISPKVDVSSNYTL